VVVSHQLEVYEVIAQYYDPQRGQITYACAIQSQRLIPKQLLRLRIGDDLWVFVGGLAFFLAGTMGAPLDMISLRSGNEIVDVLECPVPHIRVIKDSATYNDVPYEANSLVTISRDEAHPLRARRAYLVTCDGSLAVQS
jgi:hypothetical protein